MIDLIPKAMQRPAVLNKRRLVDRISDSDWSFDIYEARIRTDFALICCRQLAELAGAEVELIEMGGRILVYATLCRCSMTETLF